MIKLEKFEKEDYNQLINWINSEEAMIQFSGPAFRYPITHAQLDEHRKHANRLVYKVVDSTRGDVIGHAELNNIDSNNNSARICRILVGDSINRNRGYGKAIIHALINVGFHILKLHRIDLGVYDFNHPAIKCYRDCGFEIEGLLRENMRVGNAYWSTYNMSIINKSDS